MLEQVSKRMKEQGYEFAGLNAFTNFVNKEANFNYQKLFLVKFEYLITNYHLNIINEIRVLINEIMKFLASPKLLNFPILFIKSLVLIPKFLHILFIILSL